MEKLFRQVLSSILLVFCAGTVLADGGVTYQDIAEGDNAGIDYRRVASPRDVKTEQVLEIAQFPVSDFVFINTELRAHKTRGVPGVAIFDYDGDGDLDVYVTNGPDQDNSLYSNQLVETGQVTFVDMAVAAGVGNFQRDNTGVCFGDIDNDGDTDLYVLATAQPNTLFENQGNGTFLDITDEAGDVAGHNRHPNSCSMADVDGDGLLDIFVANSWGDWADHRRPYAPGPTYENLEHNYLFRNLGGNVFADESHLRGIENVSNMAGPGLTGGAYTWALSPIDYDFDGDVDVLFADNQGGPPIATDGSEERGWLRLYVNDGQGFYTEVTQQVGLDVRGGYMGLDWGDFNCDGNGDFFATDLGFISTQASRWFLGQSDGTFVDSQAGDLLMTPFGWGVSVIDYDNDGDGDIIYHGGAALYDVFIADNPGVVLQNEGLCSGDFAWDEDAILKDHRPREVLGVAAGDLNQDGFEDIVTASGEDVIPAVYIPMIGPPFFVKPPSGGPFDDQARLEAIYGRFPPGFYTRIAPTDSNGVVIPHPLGTLAVEINSGDNGNNWAEITLLGSAGLLDSGSSVVNRDGIGAVVYFTPDGGPTSMRPIIGGSSYASQDALAANFGLGAAESGTVEVLWPGGARNCLHDVEASERIVLPHVPCSYDGDWKNFGKYNSCVQQALNAYKQAGVLTSDERNRLRDSARRAFDEGACE